jgi:hypothetical protein
MVVYLSVGIFLPALPRFTIGISLSVAILSKALCCHFFIMPVDRLEKYSCFFRIQSGKA